MSTSLSIQHFKAGAPAIKLDLALAYQAEGRILEIQLAGTTAAKDLFAEFLRAYIHVAKVHAHIKYQVAMAAIASRKRRSVLMLDIIPQAAKDAGLGTSRAPTGSEDVREAFMYRDEDFIRIEESRAALEATQELLFGKLMGMKAAMDSCRALLAPGEVPSVTTLGHGSAQPNDPNGDITATLAAQTSPPKRGFGKPQY